MARPLTDYEKYIRTEELLALQKPVEKLAHHDEMQFQVVHQISELWMKLVEHEATATAKAMHRADVPAALISLRRIGKLMRLLHDQLELLDTMAPRAYMTIREALGRGSGQESPGFKTLCRLPELLWPAFEALLAARPITLRAIYEQPDQQREMFLVAEALLDYDQSLQAWRQRHLLMVYRQIGTHTVSLKGKTSDLLAEGMKHRFFPALWDVRDELFAEWTKAHPSGAEYGYHG